MIATAATIPTVFSDEALLKRVLKPYKENCHYLKHASIEYRPPSFRNQEEDSKNVLLLAKGNFSISQSCYILDTGHFNAVEFNICYNQLAYYLLAECIQHKLLSSLRTWDIGRYSRNQLTGMLIVKISSSFKKLICSDRFDGHIEVKKILKKGKTLFLQTSCGFSDEQGGSAVGSVLFAIINSE